MVDTTRIEQSSDSMTERSQGNPQDDEECSRSAQFPEKHLCFRCSNNACEVHAIVRGKKRKGQKHDSHASEDKNGSILRVADDSKFVLLDRSEFEKLTKRKHRVQDG